MKNSFLKKMTSLCCASLMVLGTMGNLTFAKEGSTLMATTAYNGSRVAYNDPRYERDEVLEVAGEPFFYNGVQIRIDKVVDWYHFDDAKVKQLFKIAKDDGFTVANVQIRWMDVQQDQSFKATESAYIRGGSYSNQTFNTGGIQTYYEEGNESNQALAYIKYDISGWSKGDIEGARIRVYNRNSLYYGHYITVYGLDDNSWDKDTITWNNAPGHSGYEVTGEKLAVTPTWDTVKSVNYYDFDVSAYVEKACKAGKKEVSFILQSTTPIDKEPEIPIVMDDFDDTDAPQIFLSSMEEYDWEYLDKIIGWAEEYDLKLEVLWFATDTCSLATDIRVPYYVLNKYQKQVYSDGVTPWLKKANKGSHITGLYQYIMCKNDMELRKQEYTALQTVFNHIADYNAANGYKNTVIGCQVCNEPNVARLHGGSVWEGDTKLQNCMCSNCVNLKKNGGYSDQGFRDWTMFEYCDNLSKAVKKSNYPVWTRVNNVQGNDAWGVTYNENQRAKGGTDNDNGTYLDFIGLDPYGWGRSALYGFGHGDYSQGSNLPVVMESGGEKSMSALMMLATLAGGGYYNVYDLCSPDGHHLYDQNLQPRVISAGDKYLPNGGTYIEDVRNHNHWLKKIAHPLAFMQPESLGGKNLLYYNCEGTDLSNINITKSMGGMTVTYKSDTQYSSGIALKKSDSEVVLLSSKDIDATFTLSDIANNVKSVEFGHYEGSNWIKDEGEVTYKASGNNLVVTMPQFSVIRVETNSSLPKPVSFEAETLVNEGKVSLSSSVTKRNVSEGAASGGGWACFENMSSGSTVTFTVNVPDNMTTTRISTGYKAKSSGRANFTLSINGISYGSEVNATANEGFYQTDFGPIITLNPGENTFTYKATSAGLIGIDCIYFMASTPMPDSAELTQIISRDFSNADSTNFGFDKGASISNGKLNITENMGNYTTSVKMFDAEIMHQDTIELSFDWKTNITSNGKKSGIEFRDLYGRLIFALESKSGTIFRHSITGYDSDSTQSNYDWEPIWAEEAMDRNKTYHVRLIADFEGKTVSYSVTEKDTGLIIAQVVGAATEANNLAKMVACNYYTNESGTSYTGTQNIDNFTLSGNKGSVTLPHKGKTVYVFGDSIADGHKYTSSGFAQFAALYNGMTVTYDGATNGATVTNNTIRNQVYSAPSASPDMVIFTGGINDAYDTTDMTKFRTAFENILTGMQSEWPNAQIIYVTAHKTPARELTYQQKIRDAAVGLCNKYNVTIVDMYSILDATVQETRWTYTFDELGYDNLPGHLGTLSSEKFSSSYPTGTHPNFKGIESYYVPAFTEAINYQNPFTAEVTVTGNTLTATASGVGGNYLLVLYSDDTYLAYHSFSGSISLPYDSTITTAAVFAWDSFTTLTPLAPCKKFTLSV